MKKGQCTIKDVAKAAGVSVGTASKVINNIYVNSKSKEAVEKAVQTLGYVPNAFARSLKGKDTKTIGVLFPDISSPINGKILKGIEEFCGSMGYSLLFSNFKTSEQKAQESIRLFMEKKVDGIIYASFTMTPKIEKDLIRFNKPVVSIMTKSQKQCFSSVTIDNERAAYDATRYLLELSHKRILFMSGIKQDLNAGLARIKGYKKALEEYGLKMDEDLVTYGGYSFKRGYEDMQDILSRGVKFDAFFAASDTIAVGGIKALKEKGLEIPRDVSVMGFDGIEYGDYMTPELCTVEQPFYELGNRAAKHLIKMICEKCPNEDIELDYFIKKNASAGPV